MLCLIKRSNLGLVLLLMCILLSACGPSPEEQTATAAETAAAATNTPVPPTATPPPIPTSKPSAVPIVDVGELEFDGAECTVSIPTELSPGKYSLVLKNLTEEDVNLFVSKHAGSTTFQDILDLQGEPGKSLSYSLYDELFDKVIEPGIAQQKPDGGEVHTYKLISEGEYVVGVWIYETAESDAMKTWFCAPFWVKEAPSE